MNKKSVLIVIVVVLAAIFIMQQYDVGPFRSNAGETWPDAPQYQ